jgi:hypothetical protein
MAARLAVQVLRTNPLLAARRAQPSGGVLAEAAAVWRGLTICSTQMDAQNGSGCCYTARTPTILPRRRPTLAHPGEFARL